MLPSREQALTLLEEAYIRNPGLWRDHSIIAAKCAYAIGKACDDINEDKAYILGLLHDIGRREGVTHLAHVIDGYRYLMGLGFDEAARVCITHSFPIKDVNNYIGTKDVSAEDLQEITDLMNGFEYDDYDALIQLCDSIALPQGSAQIVERMNDVKQRYGYFPESKWNKHIEIKHYFEIKTGLIIDNLNIK